MTCRKENPLTPPKNSISGFQLANTWAKIRARDAYAMVKNGKELENLNFASVVATFEKANTYVCTKRLIRSAEVRGSPPSAPPFRFNYLRLPAPATVFHGLNP
jgi:hypothetical protein